MANELFHRFYLLGETFHVVTHLLRSNLGIYLRAANTGVSHHLRQGLYRHAVREADGGRIAVTALVPRDVLVDSAQLGYRLDAVPAIGITGDGKQFPVYNPQIEMFARFKMKSSFHKTKRII